MNYTLNNKKDVALLKKKMKDNKYDYLDENTINQLKDGWHIVIAINGEKEGIFNFDNEDCCLFIQIFKKNNKVYDSHSLTDEEINGMMAYFLSRL